ncbi:MAG: hypothetical protein M3Y41_17230 [Pseudomonadota bacterium]|nr:hypothetical protein [Pseudomonadota bacterium]
MDLEAFRRTLAEAEPPAGLGQAMQALWWDAKGDWGRAHGCAQAENGRNGGDLVHAYLHRKEGDLANAGYWYRRAGRQPAAGPLQAEWEALGAQLIAQR